MPVSQTSVMTAIDERILWPGWQTFAAGLYVAGLLVLLARLVVDQVAARRLAAAADEIHDSQWNQLLDECRALMGLQTPVRLLRTRAHVTPMALGIGSPAIVIPDTADAWTLERRRAVLLHELAHIERRDCLTQTLASLTCAVYWIHPGAWWAAKRLQVEREFACDDRVLGLGAGARDYAGHLLEIAYSLGGGRTPALAVGMARRGQLEGRLLAVLDAARNRKAPSAPGRLGRIGRGSGAACFRWRHSRRRRTRQPPCCRRSTNPAAAAPASGPAQSRAGPVPADSRTGCGSHERHVGDPVLREGRPGVPRTAAEALEQRPGDPAGVAPGAPGVGERPGHLHAEARCGHVLLRGNRPERIWRRGLHVRAERRLRRGAGEARHRQTYRGAAARDGQVRRQPRPAGRSDRSGLREAHDRRPRARRPARRRSGLRARAWDSSGTASAQWPPSLPCGTTA